MWPVLPFVLLLCLRRRRWKVWLGKHIRKPTILQNRLGELLVYVRPDQMLKRVMQFPKLNPAAARTSLR